MHHDAIISHISPLLVFASKRAIEHLWIGQKLSCDRELSKSSVRSVSNRTNDDNLFGGDATRALASMSKLRSLKILLQTESVMYDQDMFGRNLSVNNEIPAASWPLCTYIALSPSICDEANMKCFQRAAPNANEIVETWDIHENFNVLTYEQYAEWVPID
jgi:hypothetical protein